MVRMYRKLVSLGVVALCATAYQSSGCNISVDSATVQQAADLLSTLAQTAAAQSTTASGSGSAPCPDGTTATESGA